MERIIQKKQCIVGVAMFRSKNKLYTRSIMLNRFFMLKSDKNIHELYSLVVSTNEADLYEQCITACNLTKAYKITIRSF